MDKIKVLILGHKGKIGKRLCEHLKSDFELVTFDGNILDVKSFDGFISKNKDVKFIINLIAKYRGNQSDIFNSNVVSTNNLIIALKNNKISPSIIHFSTGGVYSADNSIKNESSELSPISYYLLTKKIGEEIVNFYSKEIKVVILRPGSVYGDGIDDGFIFNFNKGARDGIINLIGTPSKIRTVVNIEYLISLVKKIIDGGILESRIINVGTETFTLGDYIDKLKLENPDLVVKNTPDTSDNDKLSHMNLEISKCNQFLPIEEIYKIFK